MTDPTPAQDSSSPAGNAEHVAGDAAPNLPWRLDFERVLPLTRALDAKELVPLNVDMKNVTTTVLGALPKIMRFRERAAALPDFDVTCFDELGAYARAAGDAHTRWRTAAKPSSALESLVKEATALRAMLFLDFRALRLHQLIPSDPDKPFDARVGFKKLAFDLMAIADLLRQHWPKIEHRTALQLADLDRASLLGARIIGEVGAREGRPKARALAADQRLRNFTLFVRAYDEVRRAIAFFRAKEGDVEQFAPSIYAERQRRRRKPAPPPVTPTAERTPQLEPSASFPALAPAVHAPTAVLTPSTNPFVEGTWEPLAAPDAPTHAVPLLAAPPPPTPQPKRRRKKRRAPRDFYSQVVTTGLFGDHGDPAVDEGH